MATEPHPTETKVKEPFLRRAVIRIFFCTNSKPKMLYEDHEPQEASNAALEKALFRPVGLPALRGDLWRSGARRAWQRRPVARM
jgi:hypothetical protein